MKKQDPDICQAPSCNLYRFGDSKYCIIHKGVYSEKKPKENKVEKFNPYNFKTQVDLFKYKWENSTRKCYVTGQDLNTFENTIKFSSIFAHILRKSAFKEFRLYPNNIVLLSPDFEGISIHHLFDNGNIDQILRFEKGNGVSFECLFDLERVVYQEYENEFGKKTPKRKIIEKYFKERNNDKTRRQR